MFGVSLGWRKEGCSGFAGFRVWDIHIYIYIYIYIYMGLGLGLL